jgi:glucose-6-phosphate 1-dehydrogenase
MDSFVFILLGASGDLAKRKIIPCLYQLSKSQKLNFIVVGAALDTASTNTIIENARPFIEQLDEEELTQFKSKFFYQQLNFQKKEDFDRLHGLISSLEQQYKLSGNRLLFVAAASNFYCAITSNSAQSGLIKKQSKTGAPWQRIVYEKPFGKDAESAREINQCIAQFFDESQIYRIDHYLTKEIVGNIALVRFTNLVFEPLWNNRFIDYVQVIVNESIGIEGRGAYYDHYGALRDIVQNHILEIVALLAMESPEWLHGEYIRSARVKVLEKIKVTDVLLGQCDQYRKEPAVNPQSNIETFAVARLAIENPRWAGVPFYVKTGKYLEKKETVIHIKFKHVDCLLAKHCPAESNMLTLQVAPEAVFSLRLNIKKPGVGDEVVPVNMEFCHSCIFGMQKTEAYEIIIEQVVKGEQEVSVRFDEIEAAWHVIDTIEAMKLPVYPYKAGSRGPEQLEAFEKKHGMRWLS